MDGSIHPPAHGRMSLKGKVSRTHRSRSARPAWASAPWLLGCWVGWSVGFCLSAVCPCVRGVVRSDDIAYLLRRILLLMMIGCVVRSRAKIDRSIDPPTRPLTEWVACLDRCVDGCVMLQLLFVCGGGIRRNDGVSYVVCAGITRPSHASVVRPLLERSK